jgi:thiamine biosynthesis lipoprotein
MATVFEVVTAHADRKYAEQAAHEAFTQVDRLEQDLSRYIANSDISRINGAGRGRAVIVGVDTFACLRECARLTNATAGAFDISVGPLLRHWGKYGDAAQRPGGAALAAARASVGMEHVLLDEARHAVVLARSGMSLDLGGYGKGFAVDRMAEVLQDWGVESALLHGGSSSALALEPPPGEEGWRVTLRHPLHLDRVLGRFDLRRQAINGSGVRRGQHIIDPRVGLPVETIRAAWSLTANAAAGDALSTAFMIMSADAIAAYRARNPDDRAIVVRDERPGEQGVEYFGEFTNVGESNRSRGSADAGSREG